MSQPLYTVVESTWHDVIDNVPPENSLLWEKDAHLDYVRKTSEEAKMIFVNKDIHRSVQVARLFHDVTAMLPKESFDVLIVNYNRMVKSVERCVKWFTRRHKDEILDGMAFEDVSCYLLSNHGIQKIRDVCDWNSLKICRYEGNPILEQDDRQWPGGRYLDEGSPIVLCHLLEKFYGRGSYVYVRPLANLHGFQANFVYACLFVLSFFMGLLTFPSEPLLRLVSLLHVIEPMEGLTLKVIFIIITTKCFHSYGTNPLFFL